MNVRVAFYNIHSGLDANNQPNADRIAQWLRHQEVDLCGVVEVEGTLSSGSVDWLSAVGRSAGMEHVAYGECFSFDHTDTGHGTFGNGLVSRIPLGTRRNVLLTRPELQWDGERPETEPRYALEVQPLADVGFSMLVTHFPYGSAPGDRNSAARNLAAALSASGTRPIILAGDFNAELDSPELAPLRTLDLTSRATRTPTYPTGAAQTEIDCILVRGGTFRSYCVDAKADMSDHYPVIADVHL